MSVSVHKVSAMSSGPGFDLYTEPWIPVVRGDRQVLASLRSCIVEAHLIDGLSVIDGPAYAGCLRVLMALALDAYGQPADDTQWRQRLEQGCFDAAVLDDYIEQLGSCRFDLFDPKRPFMQSATTPFQDKSIAELLPHVACGNRTPIWTPDTDATPRPLTFAQAAQALVAAQAVAVPSPGRAAGDDPKESWAGASFAGRAGIIGFCCPIGPNLFHTLMLNMPTGSHQRLDPVDLPIWRRDDIPHSRRKRFADGMVDLLTWTPRRVRLVADGATVSRVCFRGGDALIELNLDHEPHTALRRSDGKGTRPAGEWYPRKHLPHTIGWRGIPQLLALGEHRDDSRPPRVLTALGDRLEDLPRNYRVTILSMFVEYGQNSAVIDNITTDVYPLPVRAFGAAEIDVRDALVHQVQTADRVRSALYGYARDLFAVTRRDLERDHKASKSYAKAVEHQLAARIDSITRRFLSTLSTDAGNLSESMTLWAQQLRGICDDTIEAVKIDCGPNVFTIVTKDDKVAVWPAPVIETRLEDNLNEYLEPVAAEAQP